MEIKSNIRKLTQKQMAQQLSFSDPTIKKYRDQINMPSPHIRKTAKKGDELSTWFYNCKRRKL